MLSRSAKMTICADPEKQPDTIAHFVVHEGVRLESRYRRQREFATMAAMIDALSASTTRDASTLVNRIFCDSKASATYLVEVTRSGEHWMAEVCEFLRQGAIKIDGGYNRIEMIRGNRVV